MNCVNCGFQLAEGNKFCMKCGAPVQFTAPAASQPVQAAAPAQGAAQAQGQYNEPPPDHVLNPQNYHFVPPIMQGNSCIIPVGSSYRIICPDCRQVVNAIKTDETPGYPCPNCGKAYAYGGQILIYRMGSFDPAGMSARYFINVDGVEIGQVINHSSLRVMVTPGTHIVSCGNLKYKLQSNQFKINVTPEYNSFGFKFKVSFKYMPMRGWLDFPIELISCPPQEIPYI